MSVWTNQLRRRVLDPAVDLLRQGVTPEKIALSVACGVVIGVFPSLGATMLLCTAAAVVLRLNLPAIQIVNWLIYPVQLLLFIPFLRAGSWLMGAPPVTVSVTGVFDWFRRDPWGLIGSLWTASLGAILIWLVLAPVVAAAVYFTVAPLLRGIHRTLARPS